MVEAPGPSDALRRLSWPHIAAIVLPIVAAVLYGMWVWHSYQDYYGKLDSFGVEKPATIVSKYTGQRGNVRSAAYYEMRIDFPVGDKIFRGNVSVTRKFYNSHDRGERVPIRFLPDNPQIRELDPAMRGRSVRKDVGIILVLLFIGGANVFVAGDGGRRQRRVKENRK